MEIVPDWKGRDLIHVNNIGKGSFGTVYKAQGLHDKKHYAIKEIDVGNYIAKTIHQLHGYQTQRAWLHEIKREVCEFLVNFSSKYVVAYKDCWFGGPGASFYNELDNRSNVSESEVSSGRSHPEAYLYIKMDYCQYNLRDWLVENNTLELRQPHLSLIFEHVLKGLKYIHELGVIHRDIKPANIMMKVQENSKLLIQIGDFGLSTKVDKNQGYASLRGPIGTRMYMSPEMCESKIDYNSKTDVFSAGLVFLELMDPSMNTNDKRALAFSQVRKECFNFSIENPTANLVKQMTIKAFGPGERTSAKRALKQIADIRAWLSKEVSKCVQLGIQMEIESEVDVNSSNASTITFNEIECTSQPLNHGKDEPKSFMKLLEDNAVWVERINWPISHEILLPTDNFQGRHQELQKLLNWFSNEDKKLTKRMVLINGLGGIGKSELCKKFLYNINRRASRIWLHGSTYKTILQSVENIRKMFVKSVESCEESPSEIFESLCKVILDNSEVLVVVLDNVDSEHEEAIKIINLVKKYEHLYTIVTSRKKDVLGFAGETIDLEVLNNAEAKQLLVDSLKDLSDWDQNTLCQLVGNLPLALQQAVATDGTYLSDNF